MSANRQGLRHRDAERTRTRTGLCHFLRCSFSEIGIRNVRFRQAIADNIHPLSIASGNGMDTFIERAMRLELNLFPSTEVGMPFVTVGPD